MRSKFANTEPVNDEQLLFVRKGSEGHADLGEGPQRVQSHRSQLKREHSVVPEKQALGKLPLGTVG